MPVAEVETITGVFPRSAVRSTLQTWWDEEVNRKQRLGNPFGPKTKGTVFDILPEVSSLDAVTVLLDVEPVVGFEVSKNIVKLGGYASRDEFVDHMTGQLRREFERHHKDHD